MSSRRFTSISAALRRVTTGRIIGFTASRLPMIEFECDEIFACVQFLTNPRVVYDASVERSCQTVNKLVQAFYELQFMFALDRYGIRHSEIWKALPKKKTGEIAGPIAITVGNKSIHVYGFVKLHIDKLEEFVNLLRALACVDQRYLDMVLYKKEFTLRLTGKEKYGYRPVKPIVVGELVEMNTGRWGVIAEVDRRAYMLVDRWLYPTFMQKGFDVIIRVV